MIRLASSVLAFLLAVPVAAAGLEPANGWQATLEKVARGVVVLRVSVPRSFDTQIATYSTATGIVVDAERGIILTNRHVVNPGPVVAEAVFLNHEEVEIQAIYRDPVHDFGFFRYDPEDVEFMQPQALALAPEHARVGEEIRVVGNDAGEKLSILSGTLARLDRAAPNYGRDGFNDFNTFYFQAASSTSGGSSGSPVVDVHGHVVALNAGGSRAAASSYYLPLDRVARAFEHIQAGTPVSRGTLQTVFSMTPYDELRRLGLQVETEAEVRASHPEATGMLVVQEFIPGGPADGQLEVGDILIAINENRIMAFTPMEALLDDQVGREVAIVVERGGKTIHATVEVGDLHSITPDRYLETGGGILHPLSYQQARNHAVAVDGLYVASSGYVFSRADIKRGMVITELDGEPVESLEDFEARWASLPTGSRAQLRFFDLKNPKVESLGLARVDRLWFPMQRCVRDDATGRWPCQDSPKPPPEQVLSPASTTFEEELPRPLRDLAPSLVIVEFDVPFRIDGLHADRFKGTGLVVDAERGLVVVDRETVPIAMGDVQLIFAASVEVPGRVVYIHPVHNLAVVAYDPVLLGDTPVRSVKFRSKNLEPNDEVWVVGLRANHELVSLETRISSITAPVLPLAMPPRFRETNLEVAQLSDFPPSVGGVLSDRKGRVHALWASFSGGAPPRAFFAAIEAERIEEIVGPLREGQPVGWRTLDIELSRITLAEGRSHGLSESAARKLAEHDQERRMLSVKRVTAGTPASQFVKPGDLLLAVNGNPVTTFEEVEQAGQQIAPELTLLRNGDEKNYRVSTRPLAGRGTERILFWAGTILQEPYLEIAKETGVVPEGVYVTWLSYGSPANRYGLAATQHIVAVDGEPIMDMDEFIATIADRPDRSPVRLRVVGLDGRPDVITLKLDHQFWPTVELRRNGAGWERILHSPPSG